jgi:hypothetical protein
MRQERKIDRTGCQHRQLVEEYPEVIHARGGAENPLHKRPSLLHCTTCISILFLAALFGASGAFAEGLEHTGPPALVILDTLDRRHQSASASWKPI